MRLNTWNYLTFLFQIPTFQDTQLQEQGIYKYEFNIKKIIEHSLEYYYNDKTL